MEALLVVRQIRPYSEEMLEEAPYYPAFKEIDPSSTLWAGSRALFRNQNQFPRLPQTQKMVILEAYTEKSSQMRLENRRFVIYSQDPC